MEERVHMEKEIRERMIGTKHPTEKETVHTKEKEEKEKKVKREVEKEKVKKAKEKEKDNRALATVVGKWGIRQSFVPNKEMYIKETATNAESGGM